MTDRDPQDHYENPLIGRYSSAEMSHLWSPNRKFQTWRRLWIALAEAEAELGLDVSEAQIQAMRDAADEIDFVKAAEYERKLRHDVMAHVHTFRDAAPAAGPIIHLGATSCFVTDNTDLLLLRESLMLVRQRLMGVINALADFARTHKALPCLAFTHLQPAQPTTVGKRACLWTYDLALDVAEIEHRLSTLRFRSVKGTTGTQASFLELFAGDHGKVRELELRVAKKMGFPEIYPVTGQTYSRKIDYQVLAALSGIAQSASKAATDIRLLQSRREVEEPFAADQIGSSAMAYKRNPMRSERICGIGRYVMSLAESAAATQATQWMERTLDDSSNRRLTLPQAFLGIDAVLLLYRNVAAGLVVHPAVIERHLAEELPFMATENILMAGVSAGGDRQDLHERIRQHSIAAADEIKAGRASDLIERLAGDDAFAGIDVRGELQSHRFIGRAPEQVDDFLQDVVEPLQAQFGRGEDSNVELRV
ncbi:MAG: adenylosuccinate lyase [Pirellulales bacterium]|nr:adenylosuccinate lyase [Pirellulales bacterium]